MIETTPTFSLTAGAHTIKFEGLNPASTDQTDFIDDVQFNDLSTTSGADSRTSYTASYYDAADRDIADVNVGTNGGTAWTRLAYSALARSSTELLTTYVYDSAGNLEFETDPNDLTTGYAYDLLNRTIATVADWTDSLVGPVSTGSLPTPTDSTNQTTEYTYDGDNHVTRITAVMPLGETSQVTHYVYGVTTGQGSNLDDNDLLYQVQYPDPVSGTNTSIGTYNQSEKYTYNAIGEQKTYTDRNATTHAYSFDMLGRLTSDDVTAFGSGVDQTVSKLGYAFNDQGLGSTFTSYNAGGGGGEPGAGNLRWIWQFGGRCSVEQWRGGRRYPGGDLHLRPG